MARVIRGARVIPREVFDARAEASRILEEARAAADRLVRDERSALELEARRRAEAELAAAHVALETARRATLESLRGDVGALAVAVARRAVGVELEARPELVRGLVEEALSRVRRARVVCVRVHPADAAVIEGVEVVEDERLERGDCVVESELGDVDARIATRLDALARALERRSR